MINQASNEAWFYFAWIVRRRTVYQWLSRTQHKAMPLMDVPISILIFHYNQPSQNHTKTYEVDSGIDTDKS
ncbi:hypothetical protein [Vibrio parahaemolyticus]|uniref:hypothetical protein n=1 Tax=Vibrio parahaemolyticus TaxID=670 RepID=UPI001122D3D1|nr:hypothetical protein [Vibrio parahaemolyticus]TOA25374.1 hypothetical protein CGK31_07695 [Vibrio parahaemolyticus]